MTFRCWFLTYNHKQKSHTFLSSPMTAHFIRPLACSELNTSAKAFETSCPGTKMERIKSQKIQSFNIS